jgi:hypothetical protein
VRILWRGQAGQHAGVITAEHAVTVELKLYRRVQLARQRLLIDLATYPYRVALFLGILTCVSPHLGECCAAALSRSAASAAAN